MAEITTGAPIQLPTPVAPAAPTTLQKVENVVFAFLQSHYAKAVGFFAGYATSHFGVIGKFLGRFL